MSEDFFSDNNVDYKKDLENYRQRSYGHVGFVSEDVKDANEKLDNLNDDLSPKRKLSLTKQLRILENRKSYNAYDGIYNFGSINPVSHGQHRRHRRHNEIDQRNINVNNNSNYIKKDLDEEALNRRRYRNMWNKPVITYEQKLMNRLDEIRHKKINNKYKERYTVEVSAIMYITSCKFIPEFNKDDIMNTYFDVKEMMNKKDKILGNGESVKSFTLIFAKAIWFLRGNIKEKSIITSHSAHAINTNFLIKDADDLKVF